MMTFVSSGSAPAWPFGFVVMARGLNTHYILFIIINGTTCARVKRDALTTRFLNGAGEQLPKLTKVWRVGR